MTEPTTEAVDWPALWAEYQAGASLRQLEARYGVSKTLISRRARAQGIKGGNPPPGKSAATMRREAREQAEASRLAAAQLMEAGPAAFQAPTFGTSETGGAPVVPSPTRQDVVPNNQPDSSDFDRAVQKAVEASPQAVETAAKIMRDRTARPSDRLKAAALVLELASKARPGGRRLGDLTRDDLLALRAELRNRERVIDGEVTRLDAPNPPAPQEGQPD